MSTLIIEQPNGSGAGAFHRRTFGVVITSTPAQRRLWLDEVKAMVDAVFPKAGA